MSGARHAVFVINLDEAPERRSTIAKFMADINLRWSFFTVSRFQPGEAPADARIAEGTKLSNGEIGCFLSHRALWKTISESDVDYAIILEDDTPLVNSLDFERLLVLFGKLDLEFTYLNIRNIAKANLLLYLNDFESFLLRVVRPKNHLGTGAYALSRRAARLFYDASFDINMPVDIWLESFGHHGVHCTYLFPPVAIQLRGPSTIDNTLRRKAAGGPLQYIIIRITKLFENFFDERSLRKLDNQLRDRAEDIHPGMAHRAFSTLRGLAKKAA